MKLQITLALALITLASACNEDSFSQVVEIPIPEHESLPAFSADMRSGDTAIYFRLALSRGILDDPEVTDKEASVEFFLDGDSFYSLRYPLGNTDGSRNEVRLENRAIDSIPVGPAEFRVVATVDGFAPVESTQIMPAPPEFTLVSYEPDGAIDSEGFRVDEIILDIEDQGSTEDYYGFRVLIPQQFCQFDQVNDTLICENSFEFANEAFLDSQDPLLKFSVGYGLVISDQSFNGDTYRIRLLADIFRNEGVRLEVYRLTEDAYRYGISRDAYEVAGDNPFAEPVNIHNNVEGGYGYFIAASRSILALE